jgi:hypothetical protein
MKIKKLFFGLTAILAIFLILSATLLKGATLDIHLHDTYYIISTTHVLIFCLVMAITNFLAYLIIGYKPGTLNNTIAFLQFGLFVLFIMILSWSWVNQQRLYFQSSILAWAFITFILSELLLALYYFLPRQRIG